MAYLRDKDYNKQIDDQNLKDILGSNAITIREEVERLAEAEITSYLKAKYDISEEFKKSPPAANKTDQRNPQVITWMVDIALYHVHSRINPRNIPELRLIRYDGNNANQTGGAIGALKMAAKGLITLDLPEYDEDVKQTGFVHGSDNTFESRMFVPRREKSLGDNRLVKRDY